MSAAVLTYCAGWTLLVATINAIVCPFFRSTRQGLLAVHWTALNTLVAWENGGQLGPMISTLIPSGALLLLLDTRRTAQLNSSPLNKQLHSLADYLTATRDIFVVDVIGFAIGHSPRLRLALLSVLLIALILVGLYLQFRPLPNRTEEPSAYDLEGFAHEDMFVNRRNPFQAMGRLGRLDYMCIIALTLCDVLKLHDSPVAEILTLLRAIATLSLLFTPAFFGGAVQSMKTTGRTAIALRASAQRFVKFL